jgi:transposase
MGYTVDLFGKPAFLSWLPGETLFSLVARHHHFRGNTLAAHTCEQFFGHPRAGSQHDLPSRLSRFVSRTGGCFGEVDEIAKEHTLLAYYAAFHSAEELTDVTACMAGDSVAHLKLRLGILTSRFRANHPLKACESCIEADLADFGWAYWHLEHQYPGMWVCQKHGQLLRESILKATGVERFQWHLPAIESFRDWPAGILSAIQYELVAIQSLSKQVLELVSQSSDRSVDTSRLHEVYRAELERRSWMTSGGSLRMPAITASYLEHVKHLRILPELEALPETPEEATNQLGRMLRPPRSGTHPLRHLVLINWLFGSAESFWKAYQAVLAPSETLPPGPFLHDERHTKDSKDPRRDQLVVLLADQKLSMRMAAKTLGIDVGTAMAWAAQVGLASSRRPKKLMGERRRQAIAQLLKGVDKGVVAADAEVSVVTITKLLLSEVGLHAAWQQARHQKARTSARAAWEKLVRTHGGLGVKFLRSLDPAAYAWLYRNDRAWLDAHKPERQIPAIAPGLPRVMWDVRDEALSGEVARAGLDLKKRVGNRQIMLWQIYQAVPALKAKLAALDKLPLTRRAIETVMYRPDRGRTEPDMFG